MAFPMRHGEMVACSDYYPLQESQRLHTQPSRLKDQRLRGAH